MGEGFRFMGVINERQCAMRGANWLKTARNTFQQGDGIKNARVIKAAGHREPRRNKRVGCLKITSQIEANRARAARRNKRQNLGKAVALQPIEAQRRPLRTNTQDRVTSSLRSIACPL